MRAWVALLIALGAGCSRRVPWVELADGSVRIHEFVAQHPLGSDQALRADEIGRAAGASYHLVQVRTGEQPHRHRHHDLTVYVLEGRGVLAVGDNRRALEAGDVAVIPREVVHWFTNLGGGAALAFVTFTPPLDAPDTEAVEIDSRPSGG